MARKRPLFFSGWLPAGQRPVVPFPAKRCVRAGSIEGAAGAFCCSSFGSSKSKVSNLPNFTLHLLLQRRRNCSELLYFLFSPANLLDDLSIPRWPNSFNKVPVAGDTPRFTFKPTTHSCKACSWQYFSTSAAALRNDASLTALTISVRCSGEACVNHEDTAAAHLSSLLCLLRF